MKDIKDYKEYEKLFNDELVVAVRKVLTRIENKGEFNFEDSDEHNALKNYFNKFALHKKISKPLFEKWP